MFLKRGLCSLHNILQKFCCLLFLSPFIYCDTFFYSERKSYNSIVSTLFRNDYKRKVFIAFVIKIFTWFYIPIKYAWNALGERPSFHSPMSCYKEAVPFPFCQRKIEQIALKRHKWMLRRFQSCTHWIVVHSPHHSRLLIVSNLHSWNWTVSGQYVPFLKKKSCLNTF